MRTLVAALSLSNRSTTAIRHQTMMVNSLAPGIFDRNIEENAGRNPERRKNG
jgi:hypothetical protein